MSKKKIFNLDDIPKLKELYIPELEAYVKYGPLTFEELTTIVTECATDAERTYAMISKMLIKGDARLTVQAIKDLPVKMFFALIRAFTKAEGLQDELKKFRNQGGDRKYQI